MIVADHPRRWLSGGRGDRVDAGLHGVADQFWAAAGVAGIGVDEVEELSLIHI